MMTTLKNKFISLISHNIKTTAELCKQVCLQAKGCHVSRSQTVGVIRGSEHSQSVVWLAPAWEKQIYWIFDKGQSIMAKRLGKIISKTVAMVGYSHYAVWIKDGSQQVILRAVDKAWVCHISLMLEVSTGCISLPTEPRWILWLTLPAISIMAIGPMCPNTQFIVCSWVLISTVVDPFVCLCSQLFTVVNACSGHVIIDIGPSTTGRKSHGQKNTISCYTMWMSELVWNLYPTIPSNLDTLWDIPRQMEGVCWSGKYFLGST